MPSDSKKKEMQKKKDARNKKVNGTSTKKDEKEVEVKELTVRSDHTMMTFMHSIYSLYFFRKKNCCVRS
jgi:hypothetical protein